MLPISLATPISTYRVFYRALLVGCIALATGWATFSSYSAKLDQKTASSQVSSSLPKPASKTEQRHIDNKYGQLSLSFEANRGQTDASVKFLARGPGYKIFLTPAEAVLVFRGPAQQSNGSTKRPTAPISEVDAQEFAPEQRRRLLESREREATGERKQAVVRMRLEGASNRTPAITGHEELPGKVNYFLGDDSSKWLTDIPTYSKVAYHDVYPGVDLVYYGNQQQLEYDLIVDPGVDPKIIKIKFDGAENLKIDRQGNLILKTEVGEVRQGKPTIYQEINGVRKKVDGSYSLQEGNRIGFKVSRYDRRQPLVIDPILSYLSLVNGSGEGIAITADAAGNTYFTGVVFDNLLNPTPGAFQGSPNGAADAFVTKLNQTGSEVAFTTYLGGSGFDFGNGIAVDAVGNVYVGGGGDGTFPITAGALQTAPRGLFDGFVTKLNPTGSALIFSTFLGGSATEEVDSIFVEAGTGNVFVSGLTASADLNVTPGAFRTSNSGGLDPYAAKINANGTALLYLTYAGGGGLDYPVAMAVDAAGNAYLAGYTSSVDFPVQNPIQPAHAGGARGFFTSTNSGVTWNLSRAGLPITQTYTTVVDPTSPSTIYLGTDGGVFKSTDSGATWNITGRIAVPRVYQLFIVPSATNVIYAGTDSGVFKTMDGGASWVSINNGIPANAIVRGLTGHASTPNTVYAASFSGIFKTTNGGTSWATIHTGLPATVITAVGNPIVVDPTAANTLYLGIPSTQRVFKTVNGGANWTAASTGLPNSTIRTLAIGPTGFVYVGNSLGIYRTTNGGTSWSAINTGLALTLSDNTLVANPLINAIAIDPANQSNIYAGAALVLTGTGGASVATVFKSTDAGNNWTPQTNGFGSINSGINSLAVDPSNASRVYASTSGDLDGFLLKLNPTGSAASYSTFLGGARSDLTTSVSVDAAGNVYLSGSTNSATFPTTPGAYQTTLKGSSDIFVAKVNADGSALAFSTLMGGLDAEGSVGGVEVDAEGNVHVTGSTFSSDFPVTAGAFQTTIGNPGLRERDVIVAKFNSSGNGLLYSSFLGGGGNDDASAFFGERLAIDAEGNAYVLGATTSANFPAFDFVNGGGTGFNRTFVAKIVDGAQSFSITGRITNSLNAPIVGVFVEGVSADGVTSRGATSDAQGYYALINLPAGDYTVTPNRFSNTGSHYIYAPASRTFSALSSDQANANFTATQVFDIQGQVTSSTILGLGIFDVTITLSGTSSATTVTDANGSFVLRDLVAGNYTVTPSKAGFVFNPVNRIFNSLSSDQFANFTTASGAFFTVSGRVADGSNVSVSNATVSMRLTPQFGLRENAVQTDVNGNYSFPNLQAGGNYTFAVAKPLLTFTPQAPTLTNLSSNQTLNFAASAVTGLIGKIAFVSNSSNVSVMNADTTGEANLAGLGSQCSTDSGPSWSPNGAKLAFSRCDTGENLNLYTMNADGTGVAAVLTGPVSESFPGWSPDGTRFTYTFGECSGTELLVPDVFATDLAGKIQTRLTNTPIVDGISDWSPNGSTIIFSRAPTTQCSSSDFGADLYAIDAVGGNERRLTNTSDGEFDAAHSPDGTRIAYTREITNLATNTFSTNIFLMNPDGTGQVKLTPDSIQAEEPTWSPDGTKIAFHGRMGGAPGDNQIFVVNLDGTGLAQLTAGAIERESPSWQHYSISGKVTGNTDGQPVTMALAGTLTRVTQTDENGNYIFGNLTPGGNFSVSPVSTAFVFNPNKTDINNLQGNQTADFTIVPQAIPAATPPLADNFNDGQRDPARWNLGTQTQPLLAFDPQVTVVQQGGQLVITPRNNQTGLHYNGYVSVNSFDFNNATATVELVQPAAGAAQTLFAIGSDLDNFSRFVISADVGPNAPQRGRRPTDAAQLIFQVVVGGQLTTASIPYDPILHRFMRFRHEPPTNAIVFETSQNNIDFIERHRVVLVKTVSALTAELSAGTSTPTNPGTAVFDNFQLVTNTFQFSMTSFSVNESNGSATITVTRAGSTALAATVDYSTFDETAEQRTKYIPAVGVLAFAPGEASKTFEVLIEDNLLVEGSQTVALRLLSSFGAGLNSPGQGLLTIIDNDTMAGTTSPLDQADYFVRQQYYDFLNRSPDPGGFAFWQSQITSCPPADQACLNARRIRVSNAFFYEQEFQQTGAYVYRLYRAAFGNNQPFPNPDLNPAFPGERLKVPSYAVFVSDRARVVGGANLAQAQLDLATAFVLRGEFLATYPRSLDGPAFVDAILAKIKTDIGADLTSQRSVLITHFNQGGRGLVMFHLANDYWNDCHRLPGSPPAPCVPTGYGPAIDNRLFVDAEYRRAFVVTQYFGYLRRDSDLGGLLFWLGQVNRFPLRNADIQNAMVCSFITSAEYQQRFSLAVTHTNQECPQ